MGEENFKRSLMGYHKEEVRNYLDNLMADHKRIVKIKEDNIQGLQRRLSELELQVNRLREIETQFASVQEKLKHAEDSLEERDKRIEVLSLNADELKDKLAHASQHAVTDHSKEEALVSQLEEAQREIFSVKKERETLREALGIQEREKSQSQEKTDTLQKKILELTSLNQSLELEIKHSQEQLREKENSLEEDKLLIAHAILRAQEKADTMDKEFEEKFEVETERLSLYKSEIETLRDRTIQVLRVFEGELESLSGAREEGLLKNERRSSVSFGRESDSEPLSAAQIQLIKRG